MIDPHTRDEYEHVSDQAQTLLASLRAKPGADSGDESSAGAPPISSTLQIQTNPRLPLGLTIAATASVAALISAAVGDLAQLTLAIGAVAAALMGALLAVLAYAREHEIPTQDIIDVISDLERLVRKLMGTAENHPGPPEY